MPLAPVEFTFQDHVFRYTPLANMALAREHHKLFARLDVESGVLNSLAFTFTSEDFDEMLEAGGVFRVIKMLSMLVGTADPQPTTTLDGDEVADVAPLDVLPKTLDGLYLYYAALGEVEYRVDVKGDGDPLWLPARTEKELDRHPSPLAPMIAAFFVLRSILLPFVDAVSAFLTAAQTKAETLKAAMQSTKLSSTTEGAEDSIAQTSES